MTTTKELNRDHPFAYLPLILHKHFETHQIKGKTVEDMTQQQQPLFHYKTSQIGSNLGTNRSSLKGTDPKSTSSVTIRTKSYSNSDEEMKEKEERNKLKSILFDEEQIEGSRLSRASQSSYKSSFTNGQVCVCPKQLLNRVLSDCIDRFSRSRSQSCRKPDDFTIGRKNIF